MQQNSSGSEYGSVEQLKKLFSEGYTVRRISYPPHKQWSAFDNDKTSYNKTAMKSACWQFLGMKHVLSEFVKSSSSENQKGEIVE